MKDCSVCGTPTYGAFARGAKFVCESCEWVTNPANPNNQQSGRGVTFWQWAKRRTALFVAYMCGVVAATAISLWLQSDRIKGASVAAYASGYAQGLSEVAALYAEPADPDVAPHVELQELRSEVEACAGTMKEFSDYKRTEAANRANARLLGLDEGLRLSREDWTCQRWECPR